MAEIQINTTQNVNISFIAAEAGERILAWFIDVLIKIAYLSVIFGVVFGVFTNGLDAVADDQWSRIAFVIVLASPVIVYTLVLESLLSGQTIGKRIVRIQVVKIDGYQASFLDFFIRWVMRIVDINLFSGIVALVSIGSTKYHQRVGDIASGTAVITRKNKINIDQTILLELDEAYRPTYFSVIKLSDNDMRIVKENYENSKKLGDHKVILKIKEKVINVIGEEPIKEHNASLFLETVIKDYNYFTKNM
ncbi:RDD family protein [Flavicella sediminum]|uniref:RDD family protein n=1 Tax=Flavicella sediminum TaxID=2585141 RepID=UPI00111D9538|nr:RDD family protein [Flavicella sediminum]